jgi:FecR protein
MLKQLDDLTSKLLDRELDDAERSRLNQLLAEEACRQRFVELNKLHFCLAQRSVPASTLRTARAASAVHNSIMSLTSASPRASRNRGINDNSIGSTHRCTVRRMAVVRAIAVTGLILCFGLLSILQSHQTAPPIRATRDIAQRKPVAQIPTKVENGATAVSETFAARIVSMSEDTQWDQSAPPGDFLMRLITGQELKLVKGLVKMEFASKASVVLSGPAELKVLGQGKVLLSYGKLTGRSEEGDFTVQTPSAYVVDVGTAFGVAVDDAVTNVVVFDGEVHVRRTSASTDKVRLTSGMSVRADQSGLNPSINRDEVPTFDREFNGKRPGNLGMDELSLVDVICGSAPGEYRAAGSIDPEMGTWTTLPWSETKGVHGKLGTGKVVSVDWNPWVHGIFIPKSGSERLAVELDGGSVPAAPLTGGAWGPVWARRRIERHLDPLAAMSDRDVEGFWGAGTTTALLDRSRWLRDGIVGMHANVGITLDLQALRRGYSTSLKSLRGTLAHLEQSYVSQPFQPGARATFQIFVDGELRYERSEFSRQDGDAMFGTELHDTDQRLSIVVTDGNDGPVYDRVILVDPIFEISDK